MVPAYSLKKKSRSWHNSDREIGSTFENSLRTKKEPKNPRIPKQLDLVRQGSRVLYRENSGNLRRLLPEYSMYVHNYVKGNVEDTFLVV